MQGRKNIINLAIFGQFSQFFTGLFLGCLRWHKPSHLMPAGGQDNLLPFFDFLEKSWKMAAKFADGNINHNTSRTNELYNNTWKM